MTDTSALHLKLSPPGELAGVRTLLALLSLVAAAMSPRPEWLLPLAGLVHAGAWLSRRAGRVRRAHHGLMLQVLPDGRIRLFSAPGPAGAGRLGEHHWCCKRLIVLDLRIDGRRCTGVVVRSRQNARDFRRLRVWIRQKILYNDA
jgi:hypothetical protein